MRGRNYSQLAFPQLSIYEKSFRKDHQYITVLSHPGSGCVLDVGEDRTKGACKDLLNKSLTPDQLQKVSSISIEMWKPYIATAEEKLLNASIVLFHLVKYLNHAVDQVHRREVKRHQDLKHGRYALLKNPKNLSERQRIHF